MKSSRKVTHMTERLKEIARSGIMDCTIGKQTFDVLISIKVYH